MRVNVYAEEQTLRVELVEKAGFTGIRSAVTFWSRKGARDMFVKAIELLDKHHDNKNADKNI